MDDDDEAAKNNMKKKKKGSGSKSYLNGDDAEERKVAEDAEERHGEEEQQCDLEVWETLSKSFRQVQSVLDQNRALIQQANDNHQSRIHDKLVKNVDLIRQINGNISKVLSIYSDLSVNFSNIVHQRRLIMAATRDEDKVERTTEN